MRNVLGSIFSAYAYQESLLALANRLLEKDLFVHVAQISSLRQRGWRPLGQGLCEAGCGRRVWGPGVGVGVWEAWRERCEEQEEHRRRRRGRRERGSEGKGKKTAINDGFDRKEPDEAVATRTETGPGPGQLIIFSCRHIYHRTCLERLLLDASSSNSSASDDEGPPASAFAFASASTAEDKSNGKRKTRRVKEEEEKEKGDEDGKGGDRVGKRKHAVFGTGTDSSALPRLGAGTRLRCVVCT